MKWSNEYFTGDTTSPSPSRVFIKTMDANNPTLISFLDKEGYHLNKETVKFGRLKSTLQNIVSALGIFGVLVIIMALMLFSFYVQLMIAKSKDNLRLLINLGYSPKWLAESVAKTWLPMYFFIVLFSLLITQIGHLLFRQFPFANMANLNPVLHWSVFVTATVLILLTIFINKRLVRKELKMID
jgi:magnesium-transporting ATPase (P-type)